MYWSPTRLYPRATTQTLAVLGLAELSKAVMTIPCVFSRVDSEFKLVALMALDGGKNYLVDDRGQWGEFYIPALIRREPFSVQLSDSGEKMICIEEVRAQVNDRKWGVRLFNDDGTPSESLAKTIEFIGLVEADLENAQKAVNALSSLELIVPLELKVQTEKAEQSVAGLYKVAMDKIDALGERDLKSLADSKALALAYWHHLSLQHLKKLGELSVARAEKSVEKVQSVLQNVLKNDTLSFK
jgi:DNA-directed RNA polymerase subunit F